MKEMELKNLKKLGVLLASQPLKKTITKLLLSISIFSLLISWSSSTSSTLYYQNLHYYFSSYSLHLAMHKNSIFLICNGILVFLAKTSAFVHPSDPDNMLQKRFNDGLQLQLEQEEEETLDKHIIVLGGSVLSTDSNHEDKEEEMETIEEEMKVDHEFEHGGDVSYCAENELQSSCLFDNNVDCSHRDQEELFGGEEVDEEIEKLTDEELNQKFEDFIRKMKEEFKINEDPRQQLVVVYK